MSSVSPNPLNPDQLDEQLVAYLDGELAPEAAQRVENLLSSDELARSRLSQLAASWDLLDQLPRATVDDLFSRTTVEMVALAAEDELAKENLAEPSRRRRRWLEGALATLVAAVIGFVVIAVALPNPNDSLVNDLPVIHDLDLYRVAGDIDFLKKFQEEHLFIDDVADSAPVVSANQAAPHVGSVSKAATPVPKSVEDRRTWIESLGPQEKIELRKKFEAFAALTPNDQRSLRHLEEQLRSEPELRRVMQHYYDWFKTLTPAEQQSLDDELTPKDRVAKIKERRQEQDRQALMRLSTGRFGPPRDPDNAAIITWMRDFANKHQAELLAWAEERRGPDDRGSPPDRRPDFQKSEGRRGQRPWVMLAFDAWWAPFSTKSPPVTEDDLRTLVAQLSSGKKQEFTSAADFSARLALLQKWIERAIRSARSQFGGPAGWRGGGPGPERLKQFEEAELSDTQRRELQGLSDAERNVKLNEFFRQKYRLQGRGGAFPRPPSGPSQRDGGTDDREPPPARLEPSPAGKSGPAETHPAAR